MTKKIFLAIELNKILLLDAIGALLSVIFLGIVLPKVHSGISSRQLCSLCLLAGILMCYSLACYFTSWYRQKWGSMKPFLKILGIVNLNYALYTSYTILSQIWQLTIVGFIYFGMEICLIATLGACEI